MNFRLIIICIYSYFKSGKMKLFLLILLSSLAHFSISRSSPNLNWMKTHKMTLRTFSLTMTKTISTQKWLTLKNVSLISTQACYPEELMSRIFNGKPSMNAAKSILGMSLDLVNQQTNYEWRETQLVSPFVTLVFIINSVMSQNVSHDTHKKS